MSIPSEFRDALLAADPVRVLAIWRDSFPHLPAPESRDQALKAIHMARVRMQNIPANAKAYSEAWLAERERLQVARAVAIGVGIGPQTPVMMRRSADLRHEMSESVLVSVRDGLDLEGDAVEVKRRLMAEHARHSARIYHVAGRDLS